MKAKPAALALGLLFASALATAQEPRIENPERLFGSDPRFPIPRIEISLPPARGKYFLRTALANRYLDVFQANPAAGTPLQIWDKVGGPNQIWEVIPSPELGFYYLKSEMGRYLDVQWGRTEAGTPVHVWGFNGGVAQKWRIKHVGQQQFTIQSKLGTFLDVRSGLQANGTPVWTWPGNGGMAQRWFFEAAGQGNLLRGFVDMHTHPMSHLGFGRKAMHGAPGIGSIVPAGTRDCNRRELRAASIDQALGHCNSTHGGWGLDNGCGDHLRAGILNQALDSHFVHRVGFDRNAHGDHQHAGYPDFRFWPHQSSILHQQMWLDWIRRAHAGGLKVMVALTVNSELLAEILNGDPPYDDKTVADTQIDETIRFVNSSDFMKIAYSAADVREIVRSNKLAVILGMEVDKLGNFGKPGVATNDAAVRAEIQRLHGKGIRYVFPVHLVDNSFGGAAVYDMLFNLANKRANGHYFRVMTSPDPSVAYHASFTTGAFGLDNAAILGLRGFLTGLGQIPAPCSNDFFRCFPPPGKVLCCGSYERILNALSPSPELDAYASIPPGHVNTLGLTRLGEVAVNEMMKLGILIDLDHMSERSMTRTVELAEAVPGGYPLVMGHNGLRSAPGKERGAPPAIVRRIANLGGMVGVGTADTTPEALIANYQAVSEAMSGKGIAIGTDANGFERLPRHTKTADRATSDVFYSRFLRESGITSKQRTGNRTWDYVTDNGVSHYGLLPEFLFDVKTAPGGAEVVDSLMRSVEDFAQTWEKAERNRINVR